MQKIMPFFWYNKEAEEAVAFYVKVFPDSRINNISALQSESPSGPPGSVKVVEFTLMGQNFCAMTAGPHDQFNDAISMMVLCEDQQELDRYWYALLEGGGKEIACGWLHDRFGVRWQIVPRIHMEMMKDPDPVKSKKVTDEMMKMVKFDIEKLKKAYNS